MPLYRAMIVLLNSEYKIRNQQCSGYEKLKISADPILYAKNTPKIWIDIATKKDIISLFMLKLPCICLLNFENFTPQRYEKSRYAGRKTWEKQGLKVKSSYVAFRIE